MKRPFLAVLLLQFLAVGAVESHAQTATGADTIVLEIAGLDSETRDAIVRRTHESPDSRVVFACVPAGILVVEATDGATRQVLAQRAAGMLGGRPSTVTNLSRAQAEERCAQTRRP